VSAKLVIPFAAGALAMAAGAWMTSALRPAVPATSAAAVVPGPEATDEVLAEMLVELRRIRERLDALSDPVTSGARDVVDARVPSADGLIAADQAALQRLATEFRAALTEHRSALALAGGAANAWSDIGGTGRSIPVETELRVPLRAYEVTEGGRLKLRDDHRFLTASDLLRRYGSPDWCRVDERGQVHFHYSDGNPDSIVTFTVYEGIVLEATR
jgi:hypothetical protein